MAKKQKPTDTQIFQDLKNGLSKAQIARKYGVHASTAKRWVDKITGGVRTDVSIRSGKQVLRWAEEVFKDLDEARTRVMNLLRLCDDWSNGKGEAVQILESDILRKRVRVGDEEYDVTEFKFTDPRILVLRAHGALLKHGEFWLKFQKTYYDAKAVAEFQNIILQAIGDAAPDVRARILDRLKEAGAIQSVLELSQ